MSRKQLAIELGISAAMVTKLAKRGMPTDRGVEAAARWRKRHLQYASTKGNRAGTAPKGAGAAGNVSTVAGLDMDADAALERVHQLAQLAHDAIAGNSFEIVAPMLRQALQAVPPAAREHVAMSLEVWDALTAGVPDCGYGQPGDHSETFMQTFWYQIALGAELADHHIIATPHIHRARNARPRGAGGGA